MASPSVTYQFVNGQTSDGTQVNQNFSDILNAMTDGTKTFSLAAIVAAVSTLGVATVTSINAFTLPSVPASQSLLQSDSSGVITASNAITGVTTSSSAAAGIVGETASAVQAQSTPVSLTTNTAANVLTAPLTLSAGHWLISAVCAFDPAGTTNVADMQFSISLTSATMSDTATTRGTPSAAGEYAAQQSFGAATGLVIGLSWIQVSPTYSVKLATSTAFYLVAKSIFTVSTMGAHGYISAVRPR